eukprot:scpid26516/ scgid24701/ 
MPLYIGHVTCGYRSVVNSSILSSRSPSRTGLLLATWPADLLRFRCSFCKGVAGWWSSSPSVRRVSRCERAAVKLRNPVAMLSLRGGGVTGIRLNVGSES